MDLEEEVCIALLNLLQEEKIEVNLNGKWVTGRKALKYPNKELIYGDPMYRRKELL